MTDDAKYEYYQKDQFEKFEGTCSCCGECCGSRDGDPCADLARDMTTGKYFCRTYEGRLGPRVTLSGRMFACGPIRSIVEQGLLRADCAYNRISER